jgi:hypothetical protein
MAFASPSADQTSGEMEAELYIAINKLISQMVLGYSFPNSVNDDSACSFSSPPTHQAGGDKLFCVPTR